MIINREKVKKTFQNYVNDYDIDDGKTKLKIIHTYNVSKVCVELSKRLGLNEDEIDIAYLIGMLHDIGRFEQIKRYGTFNDAKSINHAELGVQILFNDNLIRKFIDDNSCDELIKKAILYHNMYEIPGGLSEKILLFSKIIRDADKIDIFRVNVTDDPIDVYAHSKEEILNSEITQEVIESFKRRETVPRKYKKTAVDNVICHIAYVFGIYFDESINIINEQEYLAKLINFRSNNPICNQQFNEIRNVINIYMKTRLKLI